MTALCAGAFLALGAGAAQAAQQEPGKGTTVQPGVATWSSAVPVSWVYVELLERLGYDVQTPTSLSNPVAYLALREGDIDYFPNGWFPLHNPQLPENFEESATVFDPLCPNCGVQGYLIDKASAEEYGIESIGDILENEEARQAFNHGGDDRIELYGCPPGWGCHEGINEMLSKFEMADEIHHVQAGYAANFAEALSQIQNDKSALYYTWAPSAWIQKLKPGEEVVWINAPGIVSSEDERASGVPGAVTDPIEMGFVAADIQVAANKSFLKNNPAARKLFSQVEIPLDWISKIDAKKSDEDLTDQEIRPLAEQWIEENSEKVSTWLERARVAATQAAEK
ncbi:glycine betaine/L-proline ABC transporter substrate-binding protein ProX [Limimonas halophila]|nr:glycine betaine/L-proline ABC transporter substrate-binding protein ProX [Limimonas halophila]